MKSIRVRYLVGDLKTSSNTYILVHHFSLLFFQLHHIILLYLLQGFNATHRKITRKPIACCTIGKTRTSASTRHKAAAAAVATTRTTPGICSACPGLTHLNQVLTSALQLRVLLRRERHNSCRTSVSGCSKLLMSSNSVSSRLFLSLTEALAAV